MAAETGAAVVHIAGGASRQAVRLREDRLRAEPVGVCCWRRWSACWPPCGPPAARPG
ncbi:hypothetical protein PV396_17960 [Streptomyces sp. ME02-8801-2C]|uniref:hypothetical protein n=1 Tax=Streptomyces sp. ME02-8801-2C TaxID=3028680 RepID=UPI0029A2D7D4|nr:hypothetical protein [Streptomyces sp. ME02-8801-2C]MDX3453812.1 hypothetical protein [Streptomyces sp. ME02-8801-2C]